MVRHLAASCKKDLIEIYKHALNSIKPDVLVRNAVSLDGGNLVIRDMTRDGQKPLVYSLIDRRLHVIGGGKCVLAMARGIAELANERRLTNRFSHGCLSVPVMSRTSYETDPSLRLLLKSIDTECRFGSRNNLPDEDSVEATNFVLDSVTEACRTDRAQGYKPLFLVLISGGGSACLSSPKHISLTEKTGIIKELVQRGADIVELNKVRRCFSNVKGGNLAMHIKGCDPDARVVSLIISDIIADPVEFIASGPTFVQPTGGGSDSAMANIMAKYGLHVPKLDNFGERNVITIESESVMNSVIGSNNIALRAAIKRAKDLNYNVKSLGNALAGDTNDIVKAIVGWRKDLGSNKLLLICGGEATVRKREGESWGLGGRTQEMTLDYMIMRLSCKRQAADKAVDVFLAGSTDGQDGPTDVSGCLASYAEWSIDESFKLEDALEAKRHHDSFSFWTKHKPDWLLKFGPTGTNVMDLYFLAEVGRAQ